MHTYKHGFIRPSEQRVIRVTAHWVLNLMPANSYMSYMIDMCPRHEMNRYNICFDQIPSD